MTARGSCASLNPHHTDQLLTRLVLPLPDLVVSGLDQDNHHADSLAHLALDMIAEAQKVMSPLDNKPLRLLVGLHSGDIYSGIGELRRCFLPDWLLWRGCLRCALSSLLAVRPLGPRSLLTPSFPLPLPPAIPTTYVLVGKMRVRYNIYGDAVNTASRMESTGAPNEVHTSEAFVQELTTLHQLRLIDRGQRQVKGKGLMRTYFIRRGDDARDIEAKQEPAAAAAAANDATLPSSAGRAAGQGACKRRSTFRPRSLAPVDSSVPEGGLQSSRGRRAGARRMPMPVSPLAGAARSAVALPSVAEVTQSRRGSEVSQGNSPGCKGSSGGDAASPTPLTPEPMSSAHVAQLPEVLMADEAQEDTRYAAICRAKSPEDGSRPLHPAGRKLPASPSVRRRRTRAMTAS